MHTATIAIIGAGNMGSSLLAGLIKQGHSPSALIATDPDPQKLHTLAHQWGIAVTTQNPEAISKANAVVFAVKPQVIASVARELAPYAQMRKPLIITIAAGIRTTSLQRRLGGNLPIIRAMPNTPALIGCGATALYANDLVSQAARELAETLFTSVGTVVWVAKEEALDTVTALSGSGPAYFFLMMEALQQAAVDQGLDEATAHALTLQTALGAARLANESKASLSQLRNQVTSPGGTTAAGLLVLEKGNLAALFQKALSAAKLRAQALGDEADKEAS